MKTGFNGLRCMWLIVVSIVFIWGFEALGSRDLKSAGLQSARVRCGHGIGGAVFRANVDRLLRYVEIRMETAPSPEGGFSIHLHEGGDGQRIGKVLCQLKGSPNPAEPGVYRYDCEQDMLLKAEAAYWLVASVDVEGAVYQFQPIGVDPEHPKTESQTGCFAIGKNRVAGEVPLSVIPAMSAVFGGLPSQGFTPLEGRFRVLWTIFLLGVILLCCFDLFPGLPSSSI